MHQLIAQLVRQVRVFFAPCGRHREGCPTPAPPATVFRPAPSVRAWYEPIDGQATALVRPYLGVHEQSEEARTQREWRRVLWFATYGTHLDGWENHAARAAA